jgi:ABC-2 type transport system permease protein/lipopolysaccharide transport system permease protein
MHQIDLAWHDLEGAVARWQLWAYLGLQDIRLRYRRSLLGPLWITLSMGVTIIAVSILYARIFHIDLHDYLPFFTVGFILWNFISALIIEGCTVFINDGGYIRQVPGPLLTYVLRSSWRSLIIFFHNFIIFFGVMAYVGIWPGWGFLEALVGLALVTINGTWTAVVTGILCARYRDIPQIIQSLMGVIFFLTPVIWQSNQLRGRFVFIEYNPFYHFLEVVRNPLIGNPVDPWSWWVTGGLAVVGSIFALLFFARYRRRIPYWV